MSLRKHYLKVLRKQMVPESGFLKKAWVVLGRRTFLYLKVPLAGLRVKLTGDILTGENHT